MSRTDTIVRMHRDGTLHRVLPDGTEMPMPAPGPLAPMTEEEVSVAARRDPDARPLTDEEFATRFQIPLGTLRDWEQGRAEPDQPAQAYLKAIAGDPEAVQRALGAGLQTRRE